MAGSRPRCSLLREVFPRSGWEILGSPPRPEIGVCLSKGEGCPHVLANPCRGVASESASGSAPRTRAPIPPPPGPPRSKGIRAVRGPRLESAWVGQVRDPAAAPEASDPRRSLASTAAAALGLPPPQPPPNLSLRHLLLGDAEASAPGTAAAAADSARAGARSPRRSSAWPGQLPAPAAPTARVPLLPAPNGQPPPPPPGQ